MDKNYTYQSKYNNNFKVCLFGKLMAHLNYIIIYLNIGFKFVYKLYIVQFIKTKLLSREQNIPKNKRK